MGYAVALPGDRADGGTRPVWFAGSTLAYDLSLTRVRAGDVATLGDLLAVAAAHAPALVRDRVQAAADAFEQAARAPGARSLEGRARAGRRASTRALERAPRAARGGGAAVVLTLLIALVEAWRWMPAPTGTARRHSARRRKPPPRRPSCCGRQPA